MTSQLRALLSGGDLRSIGAADDDARAAMADPAQLQKLVQGLEAADPVLRMRCADALEKATRKRPCALQPHADLLLRLLDPAQPREVLWHVVQMAPRVRWAPGRLPQVFSALERCLASASSIVRANCMEALADHTAQAPARAGEVRHLLEGLTRTGTPAMKARGTRLLRRLGA